MPDILYHYTSAEGLEGIIKRKELWATDIRFFSDSSEFQYTIDLARELSSQRTENLEKRVLREILQYKETDTTFCAFCLSEEGDLLSQWRGYCPREGGCSLGFSGAAMRLSLLQQGYWLERCEYDCETQRDRVNELLNRAMRDFHQRDTGDGPVANRAKPIVPGFVRALSRVAATLKHPAFSEEARMEDRL
ncbi:MAG: DUF2971 domain-containing protein [Terriglobales bacterium]